MPEILESSLSNRFYLVFIVVVGLLLSLIHFFHVTTTTHTGFYSLLLSDGIPLIFSLAVIGGGYWLFKSEEDLEHAMSIAVWFSLGMVGMFSVALLTIANQNTKGIEIEEPLITVTNMVTVGAIAGLLIGVYDSRSMTRAEELETEREKFEVVNRILRHDIRNSMSVTIARIELLQQMVGEEAEDHVESIQENSNYVIDLTKTVREVMKAISENSEPELKSVELQEIIEKEIEKAENSYERANFETDLGNIEETEVRANEMLSSVFTNIINNAVHHNNREDPKVKITAEHEDEDIIVNVEDNGPGVHDDQKEEIFGRGEKGLESEGTGIGLYLVDTLVTQYGGEVWVEDNEPEGSVFKVRLQKA